MVDVTSTERSVVVLPPLPRHPKKEDGVRKKSVGIEIGTTVIGRWSWVSSFERGSALSDRHCDKRKRVHHYLVIERIGVD